jgi:hypothetical protein
MQMNIDDRVSQRLAELIAAGDRVIATRRSLRNVAGDDRVDSQLAAQWTASVQNLLSRLLGTESEHFKNFAKCVKGFVTFSNVNRAQGVLKAVAEDHAAGFLVDFRRLVEAEVFDDFLEQAEHLLTSGYYQAAAVIAGCVLEDRLKTLCPKFNITMSDRPKLDQMNAELAKAGAYDKLIQKQVTALADLRNKAAHGDWKQFTKEDVDDMVRRVRRLVEDYSG